MTWLEVLWGCFWRSLARRQHERPYGRRGSHRSAHGRYTPAVALSPEDLGSSLVIASAGPSAPPTICSTGGPTNV